MKCKVEGVFARPRRLASAKTGFLGGAHFAFLSDDTKLHRFGASLLGICFLLEGLAFAFPPFYEIKRSLPAG